MIGSQYDGGASYDGMIDDFAMFDRVLTLEEIQGLYDASMAGGYGGGAR